MSRDPERFRRFEQAVEVPMLLLALVMLPLLVVPLVLDLTPGIERTLVAADWLIWTAFAGELAAKTYLAPERRTYLRRHWYDVALVALPFLRPLRVIRSGRLLRLARSGTFLQRVRVDATVIARRNSIRYTIAGALLACVSIALVVAFTERGADGATIHGVTDSLWWAAATVTTVGYGDLAPVTAVGRLMALALMFIGIGSFGIVTASVAAYFVGEDGDRERDELLAHLRRVEERLASIEGHLRDGTT